MAEYEVFVTRIYRAFVEAESEKEAVAKTWPYTYGRMDSFDLYSVADVEALRKEVKNALPD